MFSINWWVLSLLALPFLVWFFLPSIKNTTSFFALKIPFFHAALNWSLYKKGYKKFNLIYFYIIWVLLTIALAGPKWIGPEKIMHKNGYDIILALDLSESMALADMQINNNMYTRLSVVKHAAQNFIQSRAQDKIGLVLFGSQAYLQTPLTYDHKTLLLRLKNASIGLAGRMTALGDAIGLSTKILKNVHSKTKIIILLTDGVNNAGVLPPMEATTLAKGQNIKIYTIGLGTYNNTQNIGNMLLSFSGMADLDENSLKKIAKSTGGKYFRAYDAKSLMDIYNTINKLETTKHKAPKVRPIVDYYKWPLSIAMVLLLAFLFFRRPSNSAWYKVCDKHLLNAMTPIFNKQKYILWPILLSLIFILLGLFSPLRYKSNSIVYKTLIPRFILLDISFDMLNEDVVPNRLVRAKFKIIDLLKNKVLSQLSADGQYGLMVYTSEPFLVSPITEDARTIATFMPELEPSILPVSGNNLALALNETQRVLQSADVNFSQVLVLTGKAPTAQDISAAKKLHATGADVSILPIVSKNNYSNLFEIFARAGGGKSLYFSNDDTDLENWLLLGKKAHIKQNIIVNIQKDNSRWFILPALLCLLPLFRRAWLQRFEV